MCECGCTMGNPAYRLPINRDECYAIELQPGCEYCATPPGVIVRKVDKASVWWHDLQDAPVFPFAKVDDFAEGAIKCGLGPDEFRRVAVEQMDGAEVEDGKVDDNLAEILAEDIWKASLRQRPEVIAYKP